MKNNTSIDGLVFTQCFHQMKADLSSSATPQGISNAQLLKKNMIDSRHVFSPMSSFPMFERNASNDVAYRVGSSSLNLPSGHNITERDISYICKIINSF